MYLDFGYKLAFFHVPRTGGTSLIKAFGEHCNFVSQLGVHESLSNLYAEHLKNSDVLGSYYKFAFVRNPWDRLYSAFCYLNKGGINFDDTRVANIYIHPYNSDFKGFVRSYESWFAKPCDFVPYSYKLSPHLATQTLLLNNGSDNFFPFNSPEINLIYL